MRCGCIDIGSNTTRLLIADRTGDRLEEVVQRRAFTRLGRGLDATGRIAADKIAETAREVAAQLDLARELDVHCVRVVATAAVRRAANGEELCRAVRAASGHTVDVLCAEDEARLAFLGATRMLEAPPVGAIGVVDVGGGSSELVVGTLAGGVAWCESVAVGSGDLAEAHLRSDPPAAAELAALRARAAQALGGLRPPAPGLALAVGGSATSLRTLAGDVLDRRSFARALAVLAGEPADALAARLELDPVRVRLLPAGIALLEAASALFGVPLEISRGGLREGVLIDTATTS